MSFENRKPSTRNLACFLRHMLIVTFSPWFMPKACAKLVIYFGQIALAWVRLCFGVLVFLCYFADNDNQIDLKSICLFISIQQLRYVSRSNSAFSASFCASTSYNSFVMLFSFRWDRPN